MPALSSTPTTFERNYQRHLQHLKLKGLRPKTIDAYARAIRRIGERFNHQIDQLTEPQLTDHFTALLDSHSWSAVKLDLYGLKFGRGRDASCPSPPRTDPYLRSYRIRLLPRVSGSEALKRARMQNAGIGNPASHVARKPTPRHAMSLAAPA